MRTPIRSVPSLLTTAIGRRQVLRGAVSRSGVVLGPMAWCAHRTLTRNARFVAVVGSYGKTTTTRAVMTVLGLDVSRHKGWNSFGLLAAEILQVSPLSRYGVLEVGICAPGQMTGYARWIRPDIAIVMSIGSEHHTSLGTLESTRHEKANMVRALSPSGLAVLNGDDHNVIWMREQTDARVITFGFEPANDVRAIDLVLDPGEGTRFNLHTQEGSLVVSTRLVGRPMVYALLAAAAVGLSEGIPLDDIVSSLAGLSPTPERLQPVRVASGALLLLDTFKSLAETIYVGLDVLDEMPAQRRLVVLGDIEEPVGKQGPLYKALGRRLAKTADRVIHVGGRKSFASMASGAVAAGLPRDQLTHVGRDVLDAASTLRDELRDGDVAWIKGRSTQHLGRIGLAVAGRDVRCRVVTCPETPGCESCVMLERGKR